MANAASISRKIKAHLAKHNIGHAQVRTRQCPDGRWQTFASESDDIHAPVTNLVAALETYPGEVTAGSAFVSIVTNNEDGDR